MDIISFIVMATGIILIILSFFIKDNKKIEKEIEELSFSFYQETSALKRRLKIVEEELMIDHSKPLTAPKDTPAIHEILKNQVLELHKQGFSLEEISARSSLTKNQIKSVIGGANR